MGYVRPYKKQFFFSVLLSVILAVMTPLRPLLIQLTINKGIGGGGKSFFCDGPSGFIIEITIFQIGLLLLETLVRYSFTFITASLGQHLVRDLRNQTYRKILHLNLSVFDKTPIGTLTTRTINDIESVNDIFSDGVIPIIADLLSILSILTYMLLTNWRITLICLIPFPFLILATYFFKEAVNRSFIRVRNAVAALNAFVQEHLSGMSVVQSFTAEEKELAGFRKINTEHRDANIKAIFAYSVFFPVVELVSALSIGLLVWWTARESLGISPEQASQTAGIITSFILCLNLLFRPLRVIADKFNVLQMGMIAGERVFKVLDSDEVLLSSDEERERFKGDIKFEKVWFSYQEGVPVLKDLSFHVKPGQTMAIVGNTGSGKTTMVNLLNRLYPLSSGRILIDDIAVDAMDISSLRKQIAVVLQDVFLFSGSIMENITLRNDAIDKGKVVEAAKMIGIHDFIMKLPGGYNFNVMERGGLLSLGQRQLISFVRALLYNPAVLILDEATSSVDTESEALIQQAVQKIVSGRTSIVIAHRLSTIKKADIIMVLDKGNLVEMGTHEGLLAKKAAYFELYQKQFILPH